MSEMPRQLPQSARSLLVQNYGRGVFPPLRYTAAPPYGDQIGVEPLQYTITDEFE